MVVAMGFEPENIDNRFDEPPRSGGDSVTNLRCR
jgi:hypothetical protein